MKISLDLLLILDAIERRGSFSAAAASLHRVPSALSHAIAKLESELGITLFLREGRKATLNEAGRTLLDDGRHLLRAASELERRVQRIADGWEAEIRIALDAVIPIENIFPLLKRFYAASCGTQIRISGEVLGGTWDALATGRADLAIGAPGDPPSRSGIATRLLCTHTDFVFAIAPDHPLASWEGDIPASELLHHRAVVVADTSQELDARTVGLLEGQDVLRVTDIRSKLAAQRAGLGIGHLPRWLAEPELAAGRLVKKTLGTPRSTFPLHLAWRSQRTGKALQWFIEELANDDVLAALSEGI
ncbi:MAG: LysR family transcriptional regulator [Dechloromonas sp.]|nr:LysR family transcriptional regulator [Dechloromonas sp.]